jgi:hypothetical protein
MRKTLKQYNRLLTAEEFFTAKHKNTDAAKDLERARIAVLKQIREIGRSGDLSLIVAIERATIEGDQKRYANSPAMVSSLNKAINEIAAIERHIEIVKDPAEYRRIDQAHSYPKNRKVGLPYDEARQGFASHYTRLNNLDKSRLDDTEKKIIDARKTAIFNAGKLYAERQAKTLGVALAQGRSLKRGL